MNLARQMFLFQACSSYCFDAGLDVFFSAEAEMTPEEKLAARAKRWGLPHTGPPADSGDDAEKLAARAKRWGLPERAEEDDAEKLAARAKRQVRIFQNLPLCELKESCHKRFA